MLTSHPCCACLIFEGYVKDDRLFLEGAYRSQVNGEIQGTYQELGRYEEIADPKYKDTGGIFDIMAVTVIQTHLSFAT
jgi:type I restriction enzyme, R subunit